jgi:hypothetical protein
MRLNLPGLEQAPPDFAFTGEEFEIPLPPGRDHKVVLPSDGENGSKAVITGNLVKWTMPESYHGRAELTLEWTAELGSTMTRPFRYHLFQQSRRPYIESPDGKTKVFLKRTGVIPSDDGIRGHAGSGEVVLKQSGSSLSAWNISTCERIFTAKEENTRGFFGDADQLYILKENSTIKSFDLRSGAPLKEVSLGDPSLRSERLAGITTGISARGPLLAVETDKADRYLALVDRETLKSHLLNFPREIQQRFFITQFKSNPSGSLVWTSNTGVFRKNDQVTVRTLDEYPLDAVPDASGRFLVGKNGVLDLKPSPPLMTRTSELCNPAESVECSLDVSGQYVLLTKGSPENKRTEISVREVDKAGVELFKLIIPAEHGRAYAVVISSSQKMISAASENSDLTGIYHFDIPAMVAKLAAGTDEP